MRRVISIGYGRHVFKLGNSERARLVACAEAVAGFDMVIFSNRSHGLVTTKVSNKLTLHPTNSRNNFFALLDAFFIVRSLIKNSDAPTTLTTQDPFETAAIGVLLKKLYRVKLIIQEHGDFFGTPHWRRESLLNRLRYPFGLWVLKQADMVRTVSKRTAEHLAKHGIEKMTILPVVIDTAKYQANSISPVIRDIFPAGTFVFLSAARFVSQKNLPLLLEAFFAAQKKANNIRLLLVGRGPEEKAILALIDKYTKGSERLVAVLPWSPDVASLMRASNAYVLSSNYEGWGRVLIEAVLTQLPIVTTAVGCANEVIVSGVHGIVVPIDNKSALENAMLEMAVDEIFYKRIKVNLSNISLYTVSGVEDSTYATQWADIFGS